ncbi:MAG: peptide chain release factor N(5)-glutamine methyltransferase [Hyphomonadaceae bacterium]|nr:peptide chain release factor N(5)-glutamine methyltransferase [Hyphomonadaceae bacterium]
MSRTLGQIQCWAQRRLTEAGIEDAKLEARWLLAHLLDVDTATLIAVVKDPAPAGLAARLAPLLNARAEGRPLAHLLGGTEFYGLPFKSDRRALIPRADSECVVELALERMPGGGAFEIADLGTGSGCLLVALLARRPRASGVGVELDHNALSLARENAALNQVETRAQWFQGSWMDWTGWAKADLIISNPPYIASGVIETLQVEVRAHEPRGALDGGPDGLAAYREIIATGAAEMKKGAWLVLEIGYDQKQTVTDLLNAAGFTDLIHRRDLGDNDRAIAARRPVQ